MPMTQFDKTKISLQYIDNERHKVALICELIILNAIWYLYSKKYYDYKSVRADIMHHNIKDKITNCIVKYDIPTTFH